MLAGWSHVAFDQIHAPAMKKFACLTLVLLLGLAAAAQAESPIILVAGHDSDNLVEFDVGTGRWSEVAQFPAGSQPRGIAVGNQGEVFVGFHGGGRNIVRMTRGADGMQMHDMTQAIGKFGPGFMAVAAGQLWAAGDTDRVIYQIEPLTGEVRTPSDFRNRNNLLGLAGAGEVLYAAEYFQRSVLRFDVGTGMANPTPMITNSPHLDRPAGMTVGHNGNLYVANVRVPTVVEFDIKTGEYVRTLVNLGAGGAEGIHTVVYSSEADRYYLASGSDVFEVDPQGRILASYNSPALKRAYGIALLPSRFRTIQPEKGSVAKTASKKAASTALATRPLTTLKTVAGELHITGTPGERYRVLATTDFKNWEGCRHHHQSQRPDAVHRPRHQPLETPFLPAGTDRGREVKPRLSHGEILPYWPVSFNSSPLLFKR
ncbi:MAG: hypothetical protein EBS05_15750 [Proteobacteria bacterium]|nr:hypothetical protein [Pseudomonadota bacterium]